jgi:hypothetical protein
VLMPCAFAVEQAFAEKLCGDIATAAFLKGAVLPDEHLVEIRRMAEEHRAFRAEPEGDDIPILALEPAHKAQHIAGKDQQMGPGNAGPGAGWHRCGDHTPSFCAGVTSCQHVASPRCGRSSSSSQQCPTRWMSRHHPEAHEAWPFRGPHRRCVHSIQARTVPVYRAGAVSAWPSLPHRRRARALPRHTHAPQTCVWRHSWPRAARRPLPRVPHARSPTARGVLPWRWPPDTALVRINPSVRWPSPQAPT